VQTSFSASFLHSPNIVTHSTFTGLLLYGFHWHHQRENLQLQRDFNAYIRFIYQVRWEHILPYFEEFQIKIHSRHLYFVRNLTFQKTSNFIWWFKFNKTLYTTRSLNDTLTILICRIMLKSPLGMLLNFGTAYLQTFAMLFVCMVLKANCMITYWSLISDLALALILCWHYPYIHRFLYLCVFWINFFSSYLIYVILFLYKLFISFTPLFYFILFI